MSDIARDVDGEHAEYSVREVSIFYLLYTFLSDIQVCKRYSYRSSRGRLVKAMDW